MTSWTPNDPKWLYQADRTPEPPKAFAGEPLLGKAWQRLQVLHTPFRTIDPEEYRWIVDWLARLEHLFLERSDLESYYQECFAPEGAPRPMPPAEKASAAVAHVAALQAQFMEEVFFTLALDRHANAPDNRGWMNLFRRWGRSERFNERLDTLRSLLTLRFLGFYDYYLRYYPCRIDEDPIPHPWDSDERRTDPRPPGTLPERTGGSPGTDPHCIEGDPKAPGPTPAAQAAKAAKAPPGSPKTGAEAAKRNLLPGVYLDSGIRESGARPPAGGAGAAPPSSRGEAKMEIDRTQRPRQEDSDDEPGASAPTTPNK